MLRKIVSRVYNHIPHGWLLREILAWLVVPFVAPITNLIQLPRSIWACRVLASGQWDKYSRFFFGYAILALFQRTQVANLWRFGPKGQSTLLGLGQYDLSKWIYFTRPSLYAYGYALATVPFVGMVIWLIAHGAWLEANTFIFCSVVLLVLATSTSFYANTFFYQNYNVLGWLFLPLTLYGWMNGGYFLAAACVLVMSFASITAVAVSLFLAAVYGAFTYDPLTLITMLPAVLKLTMAFCSRRNLGEIFSELVEIAKGIGITGKNARYTRLNKSSLQLWFIYLLLLQLIFISGTFYLNEGPPVFSIAALILFIINSRVARFADLQSMLITITSAATAEVLATGQLWMLLPLWVLVNPAPRMIGLQNYVGFWGIMPVAKPYRIDGLISNMREFLKVVPKGGRVFAAFRDPEGVWEKIFDGQKAIYELPRYVATELDIHLLPDYWAVYETNYIGGPEIWANSISEIKNRLYNWDTEYLMIYQLDDDVLNPEWIDEGFVVLSRFTWNQEHLRDEVSRILPAGAVPTWWILKFDADQMPENNMPGKIAATG